MCNSLQTTEYKSDKVTRTVSQKSGHPCVHFFGNVQQGVLFMRRDGIGLNHVYDMILKYGIRK